MTVPASNAEDGIPAPPASGVYAWLPGLWVLRHYRRSWLGRDIAAGLVLPALLVPAGMGYAEAAGLPAITGLYATIGPLLAYALFGPSRIMVLGPDSALAALIASAVVAKANGDLVIAAEPITDVDTTAAEMLEELDGELATRGAELAFAELKDPVKDRLEGYGLRTKIGREFFFPTLGVAVKAFLEQTDVEWVDWEESSS